MFSNATLPLSTVVLSTQRITVSTGQAFNALVDNFEAEMGQWDLEAARMLVGMGWEALAARIDEMRGPHGLMILSKTDQGEIATVAGRTIQCTVYEVGNPVIATEILRIDVRACFLVPFRVALFDDGSEKRGQMVYDSPSSVLAPLNQPGLTPIGASLDEKMRSVSAALISGKR